MPSATPPPVQSYRAGQRRRSVQPSPAPSLQFVHHENLDIIVPPSPSSTVPLERGTRTIRQRRRERAQAASNRDESANHPGAFYGANPFRPLSHSERPRSRSRPPRDHYDDHPLVPEHFSVAPEMTRVEDVYEKDPHNRRLLQWRHTCSIISHKIFRLLITNGLSDCGRRGLYICGKASDLLYTSDEDLDRMMILLVELKKEECYRWQEIDDELSALLSTLPGFPHHGICIRYYECDAANSTSATTRERRSATPEQLPRRNAIAGLPINPTFIYEQHPDPIFIDDTPPPAPTTALPPTVYPEDYNTSMRAHQRRTGRLSPLDIYIRTRNANALNMNNDTEPTVLNGIDPTLIMPSFPTEAEIPRTLPEQEATAVALSPAEIQNQIMNTISSLHQNRHTLEEAHARPGAMNADANRIPIGPAAMLEGTVFNNEMPLGLPTEAEIPRTLPEREAGIASRMAVRARLQAQRRQAHRSLLSYEEARAYVDSRTQAVDSDDEMPDLVDNDGRVVH